MTFFIHHRRELEDERAQSAFMIFYFSFLFLALSFIIDQLKLFCQRIISKSEKEKEILIFFSRLLFFPDQCQFERWKKIERHFPHFANCWKTCFLKKSRNGGDFFRFFVVKANRRSKIKGADSFVMMTGHAKKWLRRSIQFRQTPQHLTLQDTFFFSLFPRFNIMERNKISKKEKRKSNFPAPHLFFSCRLFI